MQNVLQSLLILFPLRRVNVRITPFSVRLYQYSVRPSRCNRTFYQSNLFPQTAVLWDSLPQDCFSSQYNFNVFKSKVNRFHLHNKLLTKLVDIGLVF